MREYAFIFEKTRTGYSAYSPDIPGLAAAGSTYEETVQLTREALQFHFEAMLQDGDPIPEPTTKVEVIKTDIVESWKPALAKTA